MKIRLVKNGIFPIIHGLNKEKNLIPATNFSIAGTIQGEGKLAGIPVIFIRTSGCNLRCTWKDDNGLTDICDTSGSSHNVTEFEEWELEDIVKVIQNNLGNIRHIVISGGEPCLQGPEVLKLSRLIKKQLKLHISLETNGTIYIPELANYVDFLSISPKLRSSEPSLIKNKKLANPVNKEFIQSHKNSRISISTIQKYINSGMLMESYYGDIPKVPEKRKNKDFQLKFVIAKKEDEEEIKNDLLSKLSFIEPEDILVMPLGSSPEKTKIHSKLAAEMAIRNGWRFVPRIHLDLYGDIEGV